MITATFLRELLATVVFLVSIFLPLIVFGSLLIAFGGGVEYAKDHIIDEPISSGALRIILIGYTTAAAAIAIGVFVVLRSIQKAIKS